MWDYLLGEQSWVYCTSVYNLDFPICNYETGSHWRKQAEHNGISVSKYSYVILSGRSLFSNPEMSWGAHHLLLPKRGSATRHGSSSHVQKARAAGRPCSTLPPPGQATDKLGLPHGDSESVKFYSRESLLSQEPQFFFFLIHSHSDPGLTLCTTGIHTIEPHRDANGSSPLPPTLSLLIWLW